VDKENAISSGTTALRPRIGLFPSSLPLVPTVAAPPGMEEEEEMEEEEAVEMGEGGEREKEDARLVCNIIS